MTDRTFPRRNRTGHQNTELKRVPLVGQELRTSARGQLVTEDVIRPVFSVSALTPRRLIVQQQRF
jgi:hypothetical protein